MLCIKLHPPNIENAPPLNRSCTPSEPKLHPLNGFLSKLESFASQSKVRFALIFYLPHQEITFKAPCKPFVKTSLKPIFASL